LITFEQFNLIRDALRALGIEPDDRRMASRAGLRCPLLVFPIVNGEQAEPRRVCLKDISCDGMTITSRHSFDVGDKFLIKLANQHSPTGGTQSIPCVVVTCRQAPNSDIYATGVVFG
jgi:hypothetical protein